MIVDKKVCGAVAALWDGNLFADDWQNAVAQMCVDFYREHRRAPNRAVEDLYDDWAAEATRADTEAVDRLLSGLSDEYGRNGKGPLASHVISLATRHFDEVRLRRTRDGLSDALERGSVRAARKAVQSYRPFETALESITDVLSVTPRVMEESFSCRENLFDWGQEALDKFFRGCLARGQFLALMGRTKIGKSFWLQEFAWQAMHGGCNAIIFECGDQTRGQVLLRLATRAAGHPARWDGHAVRVPRTLGVKGESISFEELSFAGPLDRETALAALHDLTAGDGMGRLKLSVHPNSTLNVHHLEGILDTLELEGWKADVVIIDYADILAPLDGKIETRDQINATWKALRALSQSRNCLVVTATQSDADSYNAEKDLERHNFSECRSKYDHLSAGMVGINQKSGEQNLGQYRLNWVIPMRDMDFSLQAMCHTAACLALANPAVLSTF
jgi:archaellum biogenesis ATPase FlaH